MSDAFLSRPETGSEEPRLDSLTALLSRQAFIARVDARAARARRDVLRFGIAIVDLDDFKKFNLSYGLTCGDAALRGVAEQLVRTTSPGAGEPAAARYDGDAFAIVLEHDSAVELERAAHALHAAVTTVRAPGGPPLRASVGVAHARIGETAEAVLVRAEQALHLAKQFGRNRVEVSASRAPLCAGGSVVALRRTA